MDRLTDAGQEARNHMAAHAEAEPPEPPERSTFVFRRLEPVEYRLEAASEAEAFAILADSPVVAERALVEFGVVQDELSALPAMRVVPDFALLEVEPCS